ncbi:unnamed protein product [Bathycoccus prasinos]
MIRGKTLSKKAKAKSKSQNLSAAFDGLRCDVHMSHKYKFIYVKHAKTESGYHFVAKHLAPSFERFMDGDELRTKCLEGGCSLHLLRHLAPQSLCTINKYTNTIYADFIGHVENIDADMKTLVNIINSRLDKGVRPLELNMRLSTDNKNPHSLSARLPSLQFARLREKSFGADFDECNSELPTDPQVGDDAAETLQQP